MAKCPMCNSKKGKRECKLVDNQKVCSLCCGTTRDEKCIGCEYYRSNKEFRKYHTVPSYTPADMNDNFDLQAYTDKLEKLFCELDSDYGISDDVAISIYKLLLDKYYFKDEKLEFKDEFIEKSFKMADKIVSYFNVDEQSKIKFCGLLYFVSNRRTKGKREYLDFIQYHVGGGSGIMRL